MPGEGIKEDPKCELNVAKADLYAKFELVNGLHIVRLLSQLEVESEDTEDRSPDGHFLLTHGTKSLSLISVTGDSKPNPVYSSNFIKDEFHPSPDERLIAWGENRMGQWEVFVASFPSFHNITQISTGGGAQPRWRADSRELFFIDLEGKMMSATVERGPSPKVSIPRKLFDTGLIPDPTVNQYAIASDGRKFLVLEPHKGFVETYSVILNWPAILK